MGKSVKRSGVEAVNIERGGGEEEEEEAREEREARRRRREVKETMVRSWGMSSVGPSVRASSGR